MQAEHACLHEADAQLVCWDMTQWIPPSRDLQGGMFYDVLQASSIDGEGTICLLSVPVTSLLSLKAKQSLQRQVSPACK